MEIFDTCCLQLLARNGRDWSIVGRSVLEIWIGNDQGCAARFGVGGADDISSGGEISDDVIGKEDVKGKVTEIAIGSKDQVAAVEIRK